ncbi:MAG: exopolysaccharide biosynthesis protein [Desulfobulbus propionicus]|nr:MAG: exopolysaccharide biosynthesis protein [Desulfobulbus propionicus]
MGKVYKILNRAEQNRNFQGKEKAEATSSGDHQAADAVTSKLLASSGRKVSAGEEPRSKKRSTRSLSGRKWDDRLIFAATANAVVTENIRALRTRILHPSQGERPRSLLITSADAGEGKSFICANLAISMAQGVDTHSLLVDGDLRKPTQHRLFGLESDRGLTDFLLDQVPLEHLIFPSGVDKLSILPAGPPPINPAELLGSGAMASLVEEVVLRYEDRLVLLDSPPLHAASETAVLAQQVDAVILVVRYGRSRREHIKSMVEILGKDKILGIVFNAYESTVLDTKVFGFYDYQQKDYYSR